MIAAQHRILEVRKTPRKTDDSYRSTIAELPGLFTAGFTLSYLKGFLSTLATVELPPLLDNALLLAGLSFLILHLIANAQMLGKKIIPCFAVLVLMAACYVLSSDSSPFFACLVFFCAISLTNVRPLIKLWFWMTCLLVAFNSLVYGLQVVAGSAEVFYRFEGGLSTVRFGMGFVHPNMAGAFLFWLCGCGRAHFLLSFACRAGGTFLREVERSVLSLVYCRLPCFWSRSPWPGRSTTQILASHSLVAHGYGTLASRVKDLLCLAKSSRTLERLVLAALHGLQQRWIAFMPTGSWCRGFCFRRFFALRSLNDASETTEC